MTRQVEPALSVILVTPDCYDTIRTTIQYLRAQTVRDQLEVILVAPSVTSLRLNQSELQEFSSFGVVEVGSVASIGSANAKGVRRATAPLVALAEDHAFPAPTWAEALIAAHRHPWAVVGPVVQNANDPGNTVAWADFLTSLAEYMPPRESAVVERLPGNNASYKRNILMEYESELEAMMETETLMHRDLKQRGHQLYLESGAQISHLMHERLSMFLAIKYLSGRVFGAARARGWSSIYRLLFACGTPLIPVVRYRRMGGRPTTVSEQTQLPWGVFPMIWLGLCVSAVGEMIGCCCGVGQAVEKRARLEFHRASHQKNTPQVSSDGNSTH